MIEFDKQGRIVRSHPLRCGLDRNIHLPGR